MYYLHGEKTAEGLADLSQKQMLGCGCRRCGPSKEKQVEVVVVARKNRLLQAVRLALGLADLKSVRLVQELRLVQKQMVVPLTSLKVSLMVRPAPVAASGVREKRRSPPKPDPSRTSYSDRWRCWCGPSADDRIRF